MRRLQRVPKHSRKVLLELMLPIILVVNVLMPVWVFAQEEEPAESRVLREKRFFYSAFNRRDPFQSLVTGEIEESEFDLVDIYSVKLVGVLSGGMKKFAMLEDNNGFGYILKAGDPVRNGSIVSVGEHSLVARVAMFGRTTSVTLRMEGDKGKGE